MAVGKAIGFVLLDMGLPTSTISDETFAYISIVLQFLAVRIT